MNHYRFILISACVIAAIIADPMPSFPIVFSSESGGGNVDTTIISPVPACLDSSTFSDLVKNFENLRFMIPEFPDVRLALDEAKSRLKQSDPRDREAWDSYQKAYALVLDEKFVEAVNALEGVEKKYASSSWADDAGFWKAYAMEKLHGPAEGVFREYERFLAAYPESKWDDEARANMIRLGKTLALSGKPEYAEKIKSLKESDEGDIAISALTALQMMGEDSMPEIIKLYETTRNPEVRERIVLSLSNLNNAKATDFIIRVAENDTSSVMRGKAVNLLGMRISHSGIFGATIQRSISMSGPVPPVPSVPELVETPKTTGTMPVQSPGIAHLQLPGIAPMQSPEKNAEKREKILSALGRIARKDRDESVRIQALFWIAQSAPNDLQIALLETVAKTDPSISVRERVLFALSQVPENRGIPGLIAVARSDANVNLRTKAIHFLGMSKDPRARAALLEIAREAK